MKTTKKQLERDVEFWKDRTKEEVEKNKNLQQTVEHLDKILIEKTLKIRTLNHHLTIQNQRVDALLAALCGNHIELRKLQTEHMFKPENANRYEFKDGKWQAKSAGDNLKLAT